MLWVCIMRIYNFKSKGKRICNIIINKNMEG